MTVQRDDVSLVKSSCSKNTKQRTTESPVGNGWHLNGHEKVAKPVKSSEWPTMESIRNNGGISIDVLDRDLRNNVIQLRAKLKNPDKLSWYHQKGTITKSMQIAGQEFGYYFYRSHKTPKVTVTYHEYTDNGNRSHDPYVDKTEAEKKYSDSIRLLTPEEADAIITVCGLDEWAGRNAIRHLLTGLTVLTVVYGHRGNNA